jgi:hypothetical protein
VSTRTWIATVLLMGGVLTTVVPAAVRAQGCAMCRTAFDGQQADPLSEAFNVSTLFLMATPYTVIGTVAVFFLFAARRRARRGAPDEPEAEIPLV